MFGFRKWLFDDPTADWKQVVTDPVLGELRLSKDADWWESTTPVGDHTIRFLIGGEGEPDAVLLAQAHNIIRDFPAFEDKLREFLDADAEKQAAWANEIRQLNIESVNLSWPQQPSVSEVMFSGPDEFRIWGCAYMDGRFKNLTFDD